jgi:hypothetical protein
MGSTHVTNLECPCGQIHELSAATRTAYDNVTAGLPPDITVETPDGRWHVPRIFIAAHGLKAQDLPELATRYGFPQA